MEEKKMQLINDSTQVGSDFKLTSIASNHIYTSIYMTSLRPINGALGL